MVSEQLVDVRYRGLEVGRGLRLSHVGPRTAYLAMDAPLPVGSELQLAVTDGPRIAVRVLRVHESAGELPPGMRLGVIGGEEEARTWWDARVTETDPVIPEPAGGHAAQTEPEMERDAGADDASAAPDEVGGEAAGADAAGEEMVTAAGADPAEDEAAEEAGSRRARVTEVMSTAEIEAIVQDGGGEAPAGLAEEAPAGLAEEAPAGELEAQGKGKGKKRRRRARSRR